MELDGRSLLLGAGLFGIVVGVTVGLVAGASYRECVDSALSMGGAVCEDYRMLRAASFGLVGLSALVALLPLVELVRATTPVRIAWRR